MSGLRVYADGSVTGDFKYIKKYEGYSDNPKEDHGWFMPFYVPKAGKKYSCKVNGEWTVQDHEFPDDHSFVLCIRNGTDTVAEFFVDSQPFFTFRFDGARLAAQ